MNSTSEEGRLTPMASVSALRRSSDVDCQESEKFTSDPIAKPLFTDDSQPLGDAHDAEGQGKDGVELSLTERALVEKAGFLVDLEYDIIKAERIFGELEAELMSNSKQEVWKAIAAEQLFARFRRKMEYFTDVGRSCFSKTGDWFVVYEDNDQTRSIRCWVDPSDRRKVSYTVHAQIPTCLANAMVVANEVELVPLWNKLVVGKPKAVGRRTAHYQTINYQMSALGGMLKFDILNEVRRFSDPDGGFVAEYIESVPEDHPAYSPPSSGFKRPKSLLKNVWVACGQNHTVFIQTGKLEFPLSVSQWWATKIGGIAGQFFLAGLVKNSLRSTEPDNPWEASLGADKLGLYGRMTECTDSAESRRRAPKPDSDKVEEFDLTSWFEERPCTNGLLGGSSELVL